MNVEKYLTHPEIFQYRVIDTAVMPFSAAVVDACRANICGRYGKNWMCPPAVGTLDALEAKVKSYQKAAVFTCKYEIADSFDYEGMKEGQRRAKVVFSEVTAAMRSAGERFLPLGSGGCELCDVCTCPDAPCRFPDLATPSVEACGVNVMQLAKTVGLNYNNGANTVTYFSVILFDAED